MEIKRQIMKLRENWLLILLLVLLVLFLPTRTNFTEGVFQEKLSIAPIVSDGREFFIGNNFAPEVEERVVIKTASLSTAVERGEFGQEEKRMKEIVKTADGFILNENVNKFEFGRKNYFLGSYHIRIEDTKYEVVVSNLREIGEVQSFSEDKNDITGRKWDIESELEAEKQRLNRFKVMLDESDSVSDKITLTDRIFDLERKIKLLEDGLDDINQIVAYSTIYFTMTEKRSEYADVAFVKFSELITSFVNNLNGVLKFIFAVVPWIVFAGIVWLVYKAARKRF